MLEFTLFLPRIPFNVIGFEPSKNLSLELSRLRQSVKRCFTVIVFRARCFACVSAVNIEINFGSDGNSVRLPVVTAAPTPISLLEPSVYIYIVYILYISYISCIYCIYIVYIYCIYIVYIYCESQWCSGVYGRG